MRKKNPSNEYLSELKEKLKVLLKKYSFILYSLNNLYPIGKSDFPKMYYY